MDSSANIEQATRNWVADLVVGLNFCPYAKREVERESIRYQVSDANSQDMALQLLLDEVSHLDQHEAVETTLLIFSTGFVDFDEYLDLLHMAEAIIDGAGYRGKYQLASFHPDYCFDGESPEAASNYTNRSPYPVIHLLRESSLSRVLKDKTDADHIVAANIRTAEKLGAKSLSEKLHHCRIR